MIKLLSASAGSGKTYNIALFYVSKALKNEQNFEKILALTFTNAAVNEMKNRIIQKLYALSNGEKQAIEELIEYEKQENNKPFDASTIQRNSSRVLNKILHNYQNFSIFTIDSFFHKILQSSLLELGFWGNNDLIVDNTEIIDEAIEQFLFSFDTEEEVMQWLKDFYYYSLFSEKNINIYKSLKNLANEVNKEFFYFHEEEFQQPDYQKYKKTLEESQRIQDKFVNELHELSNRFIELCKKTQLSKNDFKNASRGIGFFIAEKFKNFRKGSNIKDLFTITIENFLNDKEWFAKSADPSIIAKFKTYESEFVKLATEIEHHFKNKAVVYEKARIIEKNIFNVGLINKIVQLLKQYKNTHHIIFLSDVAKLLTKFVEQNYFFIYEKLGVKYEYILIDEFQDTSTLQYRVLKPLIEESISTKDNETGTLIVGDVKQAIYRWRNGDWELMSKKLAQDFKLLRKETLKENWRSCPNIISFNNLLFRNLIEKLNDNKELSDIYNNFEQEYPKNKTIKYHGYVKVKLPKEVKQSDVIEEDEPRVEWVSEEVKNLWELGYRNIGILVRKNNEANEIFQVLSHSLNNSLSIPIVTKESVAYSNSNLVLFIIYLLDYQYTRSLYSRYLSGHFLQVLFNKTSENVEKLFDNWIEKHSDFSKWSLYSKVEYLIHCILPEISDSSELIFAQHFLQTVSDYIIRNGNNEVAFIRWFFDKGIEKPIVLTGRETGVFIDTIHSSKGLQYDAVIVPAVNFTKTSNHENYLWVENDGEIGKELRSLLVRNERFYQNTGFDNYYTIEKEKELIDDVNLLYVALTRPKKVLIVSIEEQGIGKEVMQVFTSDDFLSQELIINGERRFVSSYKTEDNVFEFGTLTRNEDLTGWDTHTLFRSTVVVNSRNEWSSNKSVAHGLLIHRILEQLQKLEGWEVIAKKVFVELNIPETEQQPIVEKIRNIFVSHEILQHCFQHAELSISERTIVSNGRKYRPDKVFKLRDKYILFDFKTGETALDEYKRQISVYAGLIKEMTKENVESYLLNVDTNELKRID